MTVVTGIALIAAVLITTALALIVGSHVRPAQASHAPVRQTPLDHAELILTRRFARGEIGREEYERSLVILRR